jgi:AmmeMemoRadiSam system protein A
VTTDRETIQWILELDAESLLYAPNRACGKIPIAVVIDLARTYNWQPLLIHYSNSGDATGNRDRVVGYSVIAFYGGQYMTKKITKKQGTALVQLARQTIFERLGMKAEAPEIDLEKEPALTEPAGTFVTLTSNGALRGCIGSLTADESILSGIKRNAVNAAFQDPRFPPLSKEEADRIAVEISVLTEPQPLTYKNPKDLLAKLTPHTDGVIIQKGLARATFLPQVWEQIPDKVTFMEHLCAKAGLPPNAWEHQELKVFTYQVQSFENKK